MRSYRTTVERDGKWRGVGPYFDHLDECENWASENMPSDGNWRVRPRSRPPIRYNAWQGMVLHEGVWAPAGPVLGEAEEVVSWLKDHREDWWEGTRIDPAMMDQEVKFRRKLFLDGDHWIWRHSVVVYWKGGITTAARVAWELIHGSPPSGGVSRVCSAKGCIRHLAVMRKQRKQIPAKEKTPVKKPDFRLRLHQKDEIRELAKSGVTVDKIAEQVGVPPLAVESVIGTARFVALTESQRQEIVELWQGRQMSQDELAHYFGILKREVRAVIASHHG